MALEQFSVSQTSIIYELEGSRELEKMDRKGDGECQLHRALSPKPTQKHSYFIRKDQLSNKYTINRQI